MTDTPRLTPPGGDRGSAGGTQAGRPLWLGLGLAVMLLLGLAVIMVLPALVEQGKETARQPPPRPAPVEPVGDDGKREQAKAALADVLHRRAELETDNVVIWGAGDYRELLDLIGGADRALDARRFESAIDLYQKVLGGFDQLDRSRDTRFDTASAAGMTALGAANGAEAAAQFRIAVALRPDDEDARRGLGRAATIEQVALLTREADALELKEQWEDARQAFAKAVALDGLYQPAQAGLERVTARIRKNDFRATMSAALNALDEGSFTKAEQALARARVLDPQAPELQEVSAQFATARRNAGLRALRKRAHAAEADEDWQTAARLHRQALKLDPAATFAESGLELAEARLELVRKMNHYLSRPQRLQASQALTNAEALLENANAVAGAGPKLRAARGKLADLIAWAQTPVPIRIRSDNATDVVVYQVGRFGRFEQRELELRPGTYTAVGSRDGYRDVRKVFRVDTNHPAIDLVIRCEERI